MVKTAKEVQQLADKMCGQTLITKQSGESGFPCNCIYIVEKISIDKELYLSITLDRQKGCPVFIYSREGGMNIEDVAHKTPEKIFKLHIDVEHGLDIDHLLTAAKNLGLEDFKTQVVFLFKHLYECFMERDADLIEINPLVTTKDGKVVAADSKVTIDDNAYFR
jgi:succinyl-CoA synthetase beta subunit